MSSTFAQLFANSVPGFSLDLSGIIGFFGGNVSSSAMATVHILRGRRWLGWYNQPGTIRIAERYGRIPRNRFWEALYPGNTKNPAVLHGYDGTVGPKFIATQSGAILSQTGHIARLFADECKTVTVLAGLPRPTSNTATYYSVTLADLTHIPPSGDRAPRHNSLWLLILAIIPNLASLAGFLMCLLYCDYYCASLILFGMFASGVSMHTLGKGVLMFTYPKLGTHRGDGVLDCDYYSFVVLKGVEDAVNPITLGQFSLNFASKPRYLGIGFCSFLLSAQFFAQLLLVPQGSTMGQIVLLSTYCVSWLYSLYVASLDKKDIQRRLLCNGILKIGPNQLKKYVLGTREAMTTFALLLLAPAERHALRRVLEELIPNDTEAYRFWKDEVLRCIEADFHDGQADHFEFDFRSMEHRSEGDVLKGLYNAAYDAATIYNSHRHGSYGLPQTRSSQVSSRHTSEVSNEIP